MTDWQTIENVPRDGRPLIVRMEDEFGVEYHVGAFKPDHTIEQTGALKARHLKFKLIFDGNSANCCIAEHILTHWKLIEPPRGHSQ